jgi:putative membrane protein
MLSGVHDFLAVQYDWIRALHILSVIFWMAGLLYLPRLFVYHVDAAPGGELDETLKVQESRLLRLIMNPAMIAAWTFGLLMIWATPAILQSPWLHVKLTGVAAMTVAHHHYALARKKFARGENTRSQRFWRILNEVPAVIAVIIVFMAVVEPSLWPV